MMNYQLLKVANDYTKYMNEVNHNTFTELELLDSIYTMYQQLEYYIQSGDRCTIDEYIECAIDEQNNSTLCGLPTADAIVDFLAWVEDNK